MMGSCIGPKENGTKEAQVAQSKELTWGSGPEADSSGTRLEGDVTNTSTHFKDNSNMPRYS